MTAADPVGESHFESPVPLTVRRGTSAMVSILNSGTRGEVVYLYDPESPRGDARFAFKSVRFVNPSGSTLEAGPLTVYGKGRFIGEGMTDAIPGNQSAVIPFALDRQIVNLAAAIQLLLEGFEGRSGGGAFVDEFSGMLELLPAPAPIALSGPEHGFRLRLGQLLDGHLAVQSGSQDRKIAGLREGLFGPFQRGSPVAWS